MNQEFQKTLIHILIVEDDKDLAITLKKVLERHSFYVQICYTFQQACIEIEKPFDCYLLDIRLPDGSGYDICKLIRLSSDNPILFISADHSETSELQAFHVKGDDYIEKPFHLSVLVAKIEALLLRLHLRTDTLQRGDIIFDKDNHVFKDGALSIHLTKTEMVIIETLLKNNNAIVSRERLLHAIWSNTNTNTSDSTLTVRISTLKKKIETNNRIHIECIRSVGYRWLD